MSITVTRRRALLSTLALPLAAQTPAPRREPLRIVSLTPFTPEEVRVIQTASAGVPVEIVVVKRDELRARLPETEVLYGDVPGKELDFAPKLKWIQTGAAGVEWMDDAFRKSPVPVTNMARVFAPGIAETGIGLLLALTRRIGTDYARQTVRREWKPVGTVRSADHIELAGRTMAVIGLGGIGYETARRAYYGFDMRIIATDARPMPKPHFVDELRDPSWFPEIVTKADVVVVAAPHTKQTDKMFNEAAFRSMKKTAYFIALSRGGLFDDMALVRALKEGWIAGAGLDVFPQEPIPSAHPIFDCPNVVITPHTSGWGEERQRRLVAFFAENVRRYTRGLPLLNVVDKQAGY
ncbi:MAG: D-2-hydroxyacid dehydrogenase [Bryobacteraceae bacterium]|nr:D-2-hydroxyacid dehydrogenase [Bryobacteraceae bacterium]